MSSEKTLALVIRQADFSESSRVVTFFTRDFGKIAAVAKGAKRLKGPFEAGLDLLAQCRIVFLRKSSSALDLLTEAQLVSRFRPAGRDMLGLYGGYYVAELLDRLTEEHDPHSLLFDEAVIVLERLANGRTSAQSLAHFELVMLREIGHLPSFEECLACGEEVQPARKYSYWVSQGGLICDRCRKSEFDQAELSVGAIQLMRKLSQESVQQTDRFAVSPEQHRQIRQLTVAALCHVLGHRPKTLRYLDC